MIRRPLFASSGFSARTLSAIAATCLIPCSSSGEIEPSAAATWRDCATMASSSECAGPARTIKPAIAGSAAPMRGISIPPRLCPSTKTRAGSILGCVRRVFTASSTSSITSSRTVKFASGAVLPP
jgi:hypothetical protein